MKTFRILFILFSLACSYTTYGQLIGVIAGSGGSAAAVGDQYYDFDRSANAFFTTDLDLNGYQNTTFVFRGKLYANSAESRVFGFYNSHTRLFFVYDESDANEVTVQWYDETNNSTLYEDYVSDHQEHIYAVSFDSTDGIDMYVDGVNVYTNPSDNDFTGWSTESIIQIGTKNNAAATTNGLLGTLDRFQVYNRALNQTEITSLQSDISGVSSGKIADWGDQMTSTIWTDDVSGYIATNAGDVILNGTALPPPVADNFAPVLSNFRVENDYPDRLYFDSSEGIQGGTWSGTKITGFKGIGSLIVNTGQTTGHYYTIHQTFGTNFTFWDNNTIRYTGGANIRDMDDNYVKTFTMQFITNNINEPAASTIRYAAATTQGTGDGLTEANAWSYTTAGSSATNGMTIYMKAGSTSSTMNISNTGTVTSPIKFIGYKTTPGDDPTLTRQIDLPFSSSEMPLFLGSGSGNGIYSTSNDYIIIKNIQVENYDADMYLRDATGLWLDNIYVKDATHCLKIVFDPSENIRVTNSYIADATAMGIWAYGSHWLIDNTWSVSSRVVNMDYHITFNAGSNVNGYNIIRNSYTHSYYDDTHGDHAISIKGEPTKLSEYTLIENCTIENSGMGIEFRHENSKRNVARNNYGTRTAAKIASADPAGSLVTFRDGTTNNTVENCFMEDLSHAIYFTDNVGEEGQQGAGHYNKVINSVFKDNVTDIGIDDGIMYDPGEYPLESTYNEFINNTFYNSSNLITNNNVAFGSTNEIINCIIDDIPAYDAAPSFSYSNFYNSFSVPSGTGNININTYFTDKVNGDFTLTASTPAAVYNGGTDYLFLYYDIDGVERKTGNYSIGAYEKD